MKESRFTKQDLHVERSNERTKCHTKKCVGRTGLLQNHSLDLKKVKPLKRKILLEKITKITPRKIKKRKITPSAVHPDPHYSGSSSQWNTHYNKRNTMTSGRAAQNKRRNSTSKLTVIDGDSILKHLQGHNFSRPHSKVHVFLAAPLTVMADHIRPLVRWKPDSLIIHIGTNILQHVNSLHEYADEIVDLT